MKRRTATQELIDRIDYLRTCTGLEPTALDVDPDTWAALLDELDPGGEHRGFQAVEVLGVRVACYGPKRPARERHPLYDR